MKFLNIDSPLMRFLSRMGDLMLLNILTAILCLPIITAGAAITALHYVSLKMVRGEEGYIFKDYMRSFKQNFKQATAIWAIGLVIILIFVGDYYILLNAENVPQGLGMIILAVSIIVFVVSRYIFPVLSHFENTTLKTIKNGVFMSLMAVPKAFCMAILEITPIVLLYFTVRVMPLVLLFGISLPAYLGAMLYNTTFKKFEPEDENKPTSDEEFHVVMDEEIPEEGTIEGSETDKEESRD
ncbi:MAG: YesL family protein [Lachnospiraceae bacterium]|nr:YesL family protein [Lachnospiraceae bacterium]MBR5944833.1 YesL family protein [Lachnospiraceae bacterium]